MSTMRAGPKECSGAVAIDLAHDSQISINSEPLRAATLEQAATQDAQSGKVPAVACSSKRCSKSSSRPWPWDGDGASTPLEPARLVSSIPKCPEEERARTRVGRAAFAACRWLPQGYRNLMAGLSFPQ